MSAFLQEIQRSCVRYPDALAYMNSSGEQLTYAELERRSNALAHRLIAWTEERAEKRCSLDNDDAIAAYRPDLDLCPVALRGHKQPTMIVAMVACMKAGVCYVPLESSFPEERVRSILEQLDRPLLIEVEPDSCTAFTDHDMISSDALEQVFASYPRTPPDPRFVLSDEDAHYILFTSGSTGRPKGVIQPIRSVNHTYRYFERFIPDTADAHLVFFNRAHFSFDLSIFDFVIALPFGHTLFTLDTETEESLARTFQALHHADPALWVSTPSYLNLCLADPSFDQTLLPHLRSVVVCGETLFNSTARKLLERFPKVRLFNTYGPTEAQGAITDVEITSEILDSFEVLPVGTSSPFNEIQIVDPLTRVALPRGCEGEICILGETIATGYCNQADLTEKAFATRVGSDGSLKRAYFTGDKGKLDEKGMLWFSGRFDDQVKVNGYRIELQEIESALNELDEVVESCVTLVSQDVMSNYLVAHLSIKDSQDKRYVVTKRLKEALKKRLPLYMIPRSFEYHDSLPKSINGKIDRKQLSAQAADREGVSKRSERS